MQIRAYAKNVMAALSGKGLLGVGTRGGGGGGGWESWRRFKAYDAGRDSRTDADFYPSDVGPNLLAGQTLELARTRVRYLIENNPIISGGRNRIRANVNGRGMWPEPDTGVASLNKKIKDFFWRHAEAMDPERKLGITECLNAGFNEVFGAGEAMVYTPIVPAFRGYKAGPALQVIDSQRLSMMLEGVIEKSKGAAAGGGNLVRQSVETDSFGRVVAYHVLASNPTDSSPFAGVGVGGGGMQGATSLGNPSLQRIKIEDGNLAMRPTRIGQLRGVPWAVAAVGTTRMEDAYSEAFLLLARAAASVGIWIEGMTNPFPSADPTNPRSPGLITSADGTPMTRMTPGQIGYVPVGAKASMLSSNVPPPNFVEVDKMLLRRMACALEISYPALSRDYGSSTFSASRSEQLEDRKGYRPMQELMWRQVLRPYYMRLLAWGLSFGELKLDASEMAAVMKDPYIFGRYTVIYPGWDWVNPQQEASADEIALRNGFKSLAEICAGRGEHWEDVMEQRLREEQHEKAKRAEMGLPPRPVSMGGTAVPGVPSDKPGVGDKPGDKPGEDGDEGGDEGDKPENERERGS